MSEIIQIHLKKNQAFIISAIRHIVMSHHTSLRVLMLTWHLRALSPVERHTNSNCLECLAHGRVCFRGFVQEHVSMATIIHIWCILCTTIRPNTNTLFSLLFGLNRIFGTVLVTTGTTITPPLLVKHWNKPSPLSALFWRTCTADTPDNVIGRVRPPGVASAGLLHCAMMTSTPGDNDDGDRIIGIPTAAATLTAVTIGGLEMTDRLINSVNILSYIAATVRTQSVTISRVHRVAVHLLFDALSYSLQIETDKVCCSKN